MLALVFGASVLFALFGRRMPDALPADAAPELFSAGRAQAHLVIARAPRPVGSDEHEGARRYLLDALGALDLQVEEQTGSVLDAPLTNLVAYVPGNRATGAVLLLAGRADEAEDVRRASLAGAPNNGWALFGLMKVYEQRGDRAGSRAMGRLLQQAWLGDRATLSLARL